MIVNVKVQVVGSDTTVALPQQQTIMLHEAAEAHLQRIADNKSASTRSNYITALRSFNDYLGHDINLNEITAEVMGGYERWLRQRGLCMNTTSCYMRSLRSLLIACGIPQKEVFHSVFTGNTKTIKRSVPTEVIARLRAMQLKPGSFLQLARNVFLFSFYAMGMPFVDVAHLKWSQVGNETIVYHRQKTGQRIVVALEPAILQIIDLYRNHTGDYVFPLLSSGGEKEYQTVLGHYNRALHRLEHLLQLDVKLTSYVVRHSWASTAYKLNVELPIISKALGHTNSNTTLTYIREIDDNTLAQANRMIIGIVDTTNRKA